MKVRLEPFGEELNKTIEGSIDYISLKHMTDHLNTTIFFITRCQLKPGV